MGIFVPCESCIGDIKDACNSVRAAYMMDYDLDMETEPVYDQEERKRRLVTDLQSLGCVKPVYELTIEIPPEHISPADLPESE